MGLVRRAAWALVAATVAAVALAPTAVGAVDAFTGSWQGQVIDSCSAKMLSNVTLTIVAKVPEAAAGEEDANAPETPLSWTATVATAEGEEAPPRGSFGFDLTLVGPASADADFDAAEGVEKKEADSNSKAGYSLEVVFNGAGVMPTTTKDSPVIFAPSRTVGYGTSQRTGTGGALWTTVNASLVTLWLPGPSPRAPRGGKCAVPRTLIVLSRLTAAPGESPWYQQPWMLMVGGVAFFWVKLFTTWRSASSKIASAQRVEDATARVVTARKSADAGKANKGGSKRN